MATSKVVDVWDRTFIQGGSVGGYRDILDRSPLGNPSMAVSETLHGLNHRGINNSIPINRDYYGMTFFTRPDMRMEEENLSRVRLFDALLTENERSMPRAIRAMLDNRHHEKGYPTSLIDPKQIFIPLLSNQLISMSGWQDVVLPTYTAEPGVYGEVYTHADGVASIYRTYDITANFRNIPGDPITSMFFYWVNYASLVYEGVLTPYMDNLFENTIDYQTRIWRIVLDSSKKWVQKIAASGPAFPIDVPMGARFNYETDMPINRADQIPITFRCIGAEYIDDILIHEFNETVCLGNSDMIDVDVNGNSVGMVQVTTEYIQLFNHFGYPRIDPETYELQWWIYQTDFEERAGEMFEILNRGEKEEPDVMPDDDAKYSGVEGNVSVASQPARQEDRLNV